MRDKNRVWIFDTTLRDGEQAAGGNLNVAEKLQIAHRLARLGVDVIEAGFPAASPGDFECVRTIAEEVQGPVIAGLARTRENDIRSCYEAVKDAPRRRIHTFIATSPIHMRDKLRLTPEEVLEEVRFGVSLAVGLVEDVEFCKYIKGLLIFSFCTYASTKYLYIALFFTLRFLHIKVLFPLTTLTSLYEDFLPFRVIPEYIRYSSAALILFQDMICSLCFLAVLTFANTYPFLTVSLSSLL